MTLAQPGTGTGLMIPDSPDLARMRRETGGRLRSAMAGRGVDAMILLGNSADNQTAMPHAAVMFDGGVIAWFFGVNAERQSLESIANPLSAVARPQVSPA